MNHCWPLGLYHINLSFTFLLCDVWSSRVYNPYLEQVDQFTSHKWWKVVQTKGKEKTDTQAHMFKQLCYNTKLGLLVFLYLKTFQLSLLKHHWYSFNHLWDITMFELPVITVAFVCSTPLHLLKQFLKAICVQTPPENMFDQGQIYFVSLRPNGQLAIHWHAQACQSIISIYKES